MCKNLKLCSHILKRYESNLGVYFFYNLSSKEFWETDYFTGSVVSSLDGQSSRKDILDTLLENNSEVSASQLQEHLCKVFDFLIEKGFVREEN